MTIRYLIAGTSSYVIYTFFLVVGIEYLNTSEPLCNAISYSLAFIYSFILSNYWVFQSKQRIFDSFSKYIFTAIIVYFTNILGFAFVYYLFEIHYLLIQFTLVLFITFFSYIVQKNWVFKAQK